MLSEFKFYLIFPGFRFIKIYPFEEVCGIILGYSRKKEEEEKRKIKKNKEKKNHTHTNGRNVFITQLDSHYNLKI